MLKRTIVTFSIPLSPPSLSALWLSSLYTYPFTVTPVATTRWLVENSEVLFPESKVSAVILSLTTILVEETVNVSLNVPFAFVLIVPIRVCPSP